MANNHIEYEEMRMYIFFETDYRKKIYSIEWLGWKWDADETISVQDNHLRWEKMAQFKTSGVLN